MEGNSQNDPKRNRRKHNEAPVTGETEEPNALQNDVVLQNIFKYLGYKDLKSCRQSRNITWLRNSKKAWWARSKVKVDGFDAGSKPMLRYLNEPEITSNATNYRLEFVGEDYYGFWERCGHFIKYLDLWHCCFKSQEDFRHAIFTQCPNLEKLVVVSEKLVEESTDVVEEPTEWVEPQFGQQNSLMSLEINVIEMPVSWMELFSHFTKLQDLKAEAKNATIFGAIALIRQQDPKMLKLKHINISTASGSDYEKPFRLVFLDPNLTLQTIHTNYGCCHRDTSIDILDLHAKSLRKLIFRCDFTLHSLIRCPRQPLQILEELEIFNCFFIQDIFKYTPNVRKVCLSFCNSFSNDILERVKPNQTVNTCKELTLELYGEWRNAPDSDFGFLVKAFPNVETLQFRGLNNPNFSLICEHLTKLVSFKIQDSEVDVAGMLGFDPDSKAKDTGVRNPNITNLKDLQSFSMEANYFRTIALKNGSVIAKELKKLHHLKKFELKKFKLEDEEQIWEKVFAEYSALK